MSTVQYYLYCQEEVLIIIIFIGFIRASRLALFEQFQNFKKPDYILVPNNELNFQKTSLHLLGFQNKQILSSKSFRHFDYAKMYITDHPYNITNITEVDHEKILHGFLNAERKILRENLKILILKEFISIEMILIRKEIPTEG